MYMNAFDSTYTIEHNLIQLPFHVQISTKREKPKRNFVINFSFPTNLVYFNKVLVSPKGLSSTKKWLL